MVVPHRLIPFIELNAQTLYSNLRIYVKRSGIAGLSTVDDITRAVLSDVVVEALNHEDRFDPARGGPMAWLLGIGINMIRRRQQALGKRSQREPLLRDLHSARQQQASDEELWDRIANLSIAGPAAELEEEERVQEILGSISEGDRYVVRLAILHGLNGRELAQVLDVKPSTARMRLHRALRRLHQAWQQYERQY
jgi:RNA polymerase sigma factor (sigma-70 family)